MKHFYIASLIAVLMAPVQAEEVSHASGGDQFSAGSSYTKTYSAPRDVFAAGNVVTTTGTVAGDVHIAGFDVDISTKAGADLYAMGGTVKIRADVGDDLTAMAYSLQLGPDAVVGGNARMMGQTVRMDGTIRGALMISGAEIFVNGPIGGDVRLDGQSITFGPAARIDGQLTYRAEKPVAVPESVAPADRITVEEWDRTDWMREMNDNWNDMEMPVFPTAVTLFKAFLISLAFFVAIGAVFLSFMPKRIAAMRQEIVEAPGRSFLLGVLGLSVLFGLVPITALTVIGLPFVPFAILLIVLAWTLGYVLGAYAVAMRVLGAFNGPKEDASLLVKLVVLAVAVCAVAVLNFIPFVGWIVNYTLVLLGIGAMTHALLGRSIGGLDVDLDADK